MTSDRVRIIDTHTHILPGEILEDRERWLAVDRTFGTLFANSQAKSASAAELINEMDSAGVDMAVAAGYGWTNIDAARLANDYALDSSKLHAGRIIPFCSVSPLWGTDTVREIERCAANGARGIGELHPDTQGFLHSDLSTMAPMLDCARSLELPVLVHASEPVGHSYTGKGTVTPDLLEALVTAYPRNTFIFAHFGGGLPFYGLMPEVRRALERCYFDSATWPFLYDERVFGLSAQAIGADKILFGSDYPLVAMSRALAPISSMGRVESESILGGNAARLFGI